MRSHVHSACHSGPVFTPLACAHVQTCSAALMLGPLAPHAWVLARVLAECWLTRVSRPGPLTPGVQRLPVRLRGPAWSFQLKIGANRRHGFQSQGSRVCVAKARLHLGGSQARQLCFASVECHLWGQMAQGPTKRCPDSVGERSVEQTQA